MSSFSSPHLFSVEKFLYCSYLACDHHLRFLPTTSTGVVVVFAVIGCSRSDLPSVPGAKVEVAADGRTAVVECDREQRDGYARWSLKCISDKWNGNVGNCTGAAVADGIWQLSAVLCAPTYRRPRYAVHSVCQNCY